MLYRSGIQTPVGITRSITKYGVTVRNREDLGRIIKEAFYIARTGRPGPVLIDLPKDVMGELGNAEYPKEVNIRGYKPNTHVHVGQLKRAIKMLSKAKKPLFLAGGGVNIAHANEEFTKLVDMTNVPVVTTVMGRGAIPTTHPLYIGNLGMHGAYACNMAVNECDLLFSIGTRFNDRITGKLHSFAPNAQIVHIDIDTAAISKNVQVDIPIVADAKAAILKILEHTEPMKHEEWLSEVESWDKEYPLQMEVKDGVNPQRIIETLNEVYADRDTVFTSDVGQHQMWASQYLKLDATHRLVQSGGLGTMGFGLPSAVGAQIGCPEKSVVSISGDGGFQMNMQELATAVCQELPLVNIVFNNNRLGMVRQMQELFFKKRYTITCLRYHKSCKGKCGTPGWVCPEYVPDFVKMAEAYGSKGYFVTSNDRLKDTVLEAREYAEKNKKPVIVECMVAPDELVMPMIKGGASFEDIML